MACEEINDATSSAAAHPSSFDSVQTLQSFGMYSSFECGKIAIFMTSPWYMVVCNISVPCRIAAPFSNSVLFPMLAIACRLCPWLRVFKHAKSCAPLNSVLTVSRSLLRSL